MKLKRTKYCGAFREVDNGEIHVAAGWVQNKRDMGGVVFIDLRDREGILQVVFDARNLSSEDFRVADALKAESVIAVRGIMRRRDDETVNARIVTGTVELAASEIDVLSAAARLPYNLDDGDSVREDLRLKYRFLDLRRHEMQENLRFRSAVQKVTSDFLEEQGFISVETPILTKSTPEGARDYLVPSRVHKGDFYALPQSPQIFKQLLMVSGVDKYYQVARCFRDEDLRADRQPEFTQVDLEMSFVDQEDMLVILEELFVHIVRGVKNVELPRPFRRLTWQQSMDTYGSDKPDLRFCMSIVELSEFLSDCEFSVFKSVLKGGGFVRAINAKGCGDIPRSVIEGLTEKAISFGARGMAWIAIKEDGSPYSILTKYFSEAKMTQLIDKMDARPGDFIIFCADSFDVVCRTLGGLRIEIADMLGLRNYKDMEFLFITDFPQFEYSAQEKRYVATHHPFTMPHEEDLQFLLTDKGKVRAQAYDVVLNGVELGSGSVRIHRSDIQKDMFKALGFTEEETEERFGFMVNAFRYGTPPHAGFAYGLDRLVMLLVGANSLREIIAFPKIKDGSCPMTNAPGPVDDDQLDMLGIFDMASRGESDGVGGKAAGGATRGGVSRINIDKLLELSELSLDGVEKKAFEKELTKMASFASEICDVSAGDAVLPYGYETVNVFREDVVFDGWDREKLLENTAEVREHCPFVPQVVD